MSYFKQLDGLRAIALLIVLCCHWLPSISFFHSYNIGELSLGTFFVLSGFLITRILLEKKNQYLKNETSILRALNIFYFRRCLRIFPIYYLFLIFLFGLNFEAIRSEIFYHGLYISNFLFVLNGEFSNGLAHLWSLSVEEQFYLIWPLLIFWIPLEKLKLFFYCTILVGIISFSVLSNLIPLGGLLVFARIDAFAWGGLLALLLNQNKITILTSQNKLIFVLSLVFVSLHFISLGALQPLRESLFYVIFFFFLAKLIVNENRIFSKIFENRILRYLGKISYGIYLYHNVMQWLLPYFTEKYGIPFPDKENEFLRFCLYLIVTIFIASMSWFLIEKPLVKIKNKYS